MKKECRVFITQIRYEHSTWSSETFQIRTETCSFQFLEGDGYCAFLIVENELQIILVQNDRIEEGVDQASAMLRFFHVQLAQTAEPETDLLLRQRRTGHFFLCDLHGQAGLLPLQLFHPLFCRSCQNPLFDGAEQIVDRSLRFCILLMEKGENRVFTAQQIQDGVCYLVD